MKNKKEMKKEITNKTITESELTDMFGEGGKEEVKEFYESECSECRGQGFWWKQKCKLELGAKFTEPKKIICPKCGGSGKFRIKTNLK